ncbi:autotransporter outer membrane beta-barrel domain-containing protein [Stenotrophomonas maltophilia]|nr:autotransporter outer membrane beta-barrel domain-containing protein [Stenotrophomonas maltophilia]MCI1087715.1 autotransporter outer membrane beta-barrel domain-containing protein [Stenotrophomonas maltophilia]MCI1116787.1 autotransporter outer membrane beta-barrel domain-containing protein [Stenotrophomonas maltophilia]
MASLLPSLPASAQQVVADGTQETPPAGTYQTASGHAFHALNSGSITPLGAVVLQTSGAGDAGAYAEGPGSRITLAGAEVSTTGADAWGLAAVDGELDASGVTLETSGARSHGVVAQGGRVTLSDGDILVRGLSAHGLYVSGLGELVFRGGQVVVEGGNANAVRATGQGGVESFAIVSDATLLSRAAGSTVVLADAAGVVQLTDSQVVHDGGGVGLGVVAQVGSQASLLNVDIDMRGSNAVGLGAGGRVDMAGGSIRALASGSRAVNLTGARASLSDVEIQAYTGIFLRDTVTLDLRGGSVEADQVALDVNGLGNTVTVDGTSFLSHAQAAVRVYANSTLSMRGSTVQTQGDSDVGMDLRAGAITLQDVQIGTSGANSHGLYADVNIPGVLPAINAARMTITTNGDSAAGVVVRSGASVDMTNTDVLTRGAGATGVLSRGQGRLTLTNTHVRTEGTDAWAARIEDNGRLTIDGGSLVSAQGGGLWLRSSRDSELVLANGARLAGGNGIALALDAAVAGSFNVRLQDGAQMEGDVALHPDDVAAGLVPQSQVQVALSGASLWTGGTVLAQGVTLDGDSQWILRGASKIDALEVAHGSLLLSGDGTGGMSTLAISGDLQSSNATFQFSGALGGDGSALGHIHVQGDTRGDAGIRVVNTGGAGAATTDGIELIAVDGASLATYTLVGRAVAGLHEYFLHKGGVTGGEGNWYLRSVASDPCEVDPEAPGCKPVDPGPGPDPDPDPEPEPEPVLRPEPGAYLANQVAALGMFQHRLHDRVGEPVFAQGRNAWVRVVRQQPQFTTLGGQLSVRGGTSVVQLGGDLLHTDGWNLGVMLGAGYGSHDVTSDLTEYQAKGRLRGTAAGVYSTWRQNPVQGNGLYLDASIQFARFDNRVQGDGLARETYDSRATLGSLEAGYTVPVWKGAGSTLYLQPQVQLEHVHYRADRHVEATGTVVDNDQAGGWEGRAGFRLFGRGNQGSAVVQPFVALNWLRGPRTNSLDFNGETLGADVPRNRYEVQAGAELQLGTHWAAWGSASVQRGDDDYRSVAGQLGVRMAW